MHTFATPAPVAAIVTVPAGRIHVTAADRDDTVVEVRAADPSKGRDVKLAAQVTAAYSDGVLRVTAPDRSRVLGSTGAVEVTVQVPAGSRVEARTASAQFTTEGPLGGVAFDSAQGTVTVAEAATVRVSVADGDVTVGRLGGDAQIRTVRGDIKVTEAMHGTVVLRTEAGSVTVAAASGVSAVLDAGTTVGRIRNSLANAGAPVLAIQATATVGDITASSL